MRKRIDLGTDEKGSILIVTLIVLVMLTLLGISATTSTDIELQIAGNERAFVHEFYVADSAWREGVEWLNTKVAVPVVANASTFSNVLSGVTTETTQDNYLNVKNFGDGAAGDFNEDFQTNTHDNSLGASPINYWYKLAYADEAAIAGEIVPGSGKNYRRYNFRVNSIAGENTQREVEVTAARVFKTGY